MMMNIDVMIKPELDQDFLPAVLWNKAYRDLVRGLVSDLVQESGAGSEVAIALLRPDQTCSVFHTQILPLSEKDKENEKLTLRYLERILKFLFWQRGGCSGAHRRLRFLGG